MPTTFSPCAGPSYSPAEEAAIHDVLLKAYRWQYIVTGVQEPRFAEVLKALVDPGADGAHRPGALADPRARRSLKKPATASATGRRAGSGSAHALKGAKMSSSNHQVVRPADARPSCCCIRAPVRRASGRGWSRRCNPRFRVHAVEFHGHGRRAAWRGDAPLTLADEAALVAPLLAEAGGAHLVGHSYGGAVALKVATMHPGQVRSLVAYEPVLFRWLIDDTAPPAGARCRRDRRRDPRSARHEPEALGGAAIRRLLVRRRLVGIDARPQTGSIATRMRAVLQHFDALFAEPLTARRSWPASECRCCS